MQIEHLHEIKKSIHPKWQEILYGDIIKPIFIESIKKIKHIQSQDISPPYPLLLNAFTQYPPKVVIIGSDPHNQPDEDHGLAFSAANGIMDDRMKSIALAIKKSINEDLSTGNLEHWSSQGVLLLNRRLTTTMGIHKDPLHKCWETFTNAVIDYIDINLPDTIIVLWGSDAQKITTKNCPRLTFSHPHPASRKDFSQCTHFIDINKLLIEKQLEPIKWSTTNTNTNTFTDTPINNGMESLHKSPLETHTIFTDGACTKNGKVGSKASYAYIFTEGSLKDTTGTGLVPLTELYPPSNNRGELLAFIKLYEYLSTWDTPAKFNIYSDSSYVIGITTKWYDKWVSENRVDDMKNPDYTRRLDELKKLLINRGCVLEIKYSPAHQKEPLEGTSEHDIWKGNFMADQLATGVLAQKDTI